MSPQASDFNHLIVLFSIRYKEDTLTPPPTPTQVRWRRSNLKERLKWDQLRKLHHILPKGPLPNCLTWHLSLHLQHRQKLAPRESAGWAEVWASGSNLKASHVRKDLTMVLQPTPVLSSYWEGKNMRMQRYGLGIEFTALYSWSWGERSKNLSEQFIIC